MSARIARLWIGAMPTLTSRRTPAPTPLAAAITSNPPSFRGASTTCAAISVNKPPSQPVMPRHRWMAFGTSARCGNALPPVVVNVATMSNHALTCPRLGVTNTSGIAANTGRINQASSNVNSSCCAVSRSAIGRRRTASPVAANNVPTEGYRKPRAVRHSPSVTA